MTNYICQRCNYSTHLKSNFRRHIFRKKICKPKISDTSILEMVKFYNLVDFNDLESMPSKILRPPPIFLQHNSKFLQKNYKCNYCNKIFTRIDNKNRHEKNRCKFKKNLELEIIELKKEIKEIKEVKNTKIINNNTTNNNIIINNFFDDSNDEKLFARLSNKQNLKLLNKLPYNKLLPIFLQKIYFDKDHPENINILCTNLQSKLCDVYINDSYKKVNKKEAYEIVSDKLSFVIQDLGETYNDNLNHKGKQNNFLSIENLSNPLEHYDTINVELYNNTKNINL